MSVLVLVDFVACESEIGGESIFVRDELQLVLISKRQSIIVLGRGGWWDELSSDISEVDTEPLQEALNIVFGALEFRLSFGEMKKK